MGLVGKACGEGWGPQEYDRTAPRRSVFGIALKALLLISDKSGKQIGAWAKCRLQAFELLLDSQECQSTVNTMQSSMRKQSLKGFRKTKQGQNFNSTGSFSDMPLQPCNFHKRETLLDDFMNS
eukprot:5344711-Amphidinium_carterae.1